MTFSQARLLRLSPEDNVLVALTELKTGDGAAVGDARISVCEDIPSGHKVAARAIAAGEKIIKYGVPIGSATRAIAIGSHVHTHNLRSDYLPGPLEQSA